MFGAAPFRDVKNVATLPVSASLHICALHLVSRGDIRLPPWLRIQRMQLISEVSDAQLVTSVARYSEVALAEVYRRHGGAVYGLARRVLNNASEAEDVTQEVFLRLWNEPDRFDPSRGSLRSFLLAQSHARAVDAIRSLNARRLREAKDARRTASEAYDMHHEVWDLALADQVARALGDLPDDERRAIELAYYEGHTYVQVAEMLHQPEGTIKSRIRNGMRRMRAVLVEAGVQGAEA
jgi:RNA polymerase sigma-70 factor (ECF subfamily)